jgi:hypothetical protein
VSATSRLFPDPAIQALIEDLAIAEVLHFTTNKGLVGIFATRAILSRARLDTEQYVEHIYTPNCNDRLKDIDWIDYVSLSISRVNDRMFKTSKRWHETEDVWWAVLALDPSVLAEPGVWFTSTNNTYTATVKRGVGVDGLAALFAAEVPWGHWGSVCKRFKGMPSMWTTDPQAEVLYPQQVPMECLRAVYVRDPEHADHVNSLFGLFPTVPRVPVEYKPEVFQ